MSKPSPARSPLALSATSLALALLAACGGGGGGSESPNDANLPAAAPTARALTALYVTDDFSAAHDAVWISVRRITAVGPSGETELLRYDTPRLLNLPTLRRAGALLATASVPTDATEVRVHVDGAARLQQLDGSMQDVTLQASGGYLSFRLDTWDKGSGALALDFDLPNFQLQGSTLVAATRVAGNSDLAGWNSRHTEVQGTVTQVSASSITVQSATLGLQTFALDTQSTLVSERSAAWTPAVGSRVEVYGSVAGQGAQNLSFVARSVKDRSDSGTAATAKVHGSVTALANGVLTLAVDRSSLASATGSISLDVRQASFRRGSAALLAVGQRIEAYVLAQGSSGFAASVVEIEGAAKAGDSSLGSNDNDRGYAELKGLVTQVNGQKVVVMPMYNLRLPLAAAGSPTTLDLSGAYFERGSLACVTAGRAIELKGTVDGNGQLLPVKVELEGGCASAAPLGGVTATSPSTPTVYAGSQFVEVKGLVKAVRAGEFDLQVYGIEALGATPATLTVRHGAGTVFKQFNAGALAAGQFVEIKGMLAGALLDASKVERD